MTPNQVKASYRRGLRDRVTVRRYTGSGPDAPYFDAENIRARVSGFTPEQLVDNLREGDRQVILYADDLIAKGLISLTASDKVIDKGREFAVIGLDDATRRVGGVLVAYELHCRGA